MANIALTLAGTVFTAPNGSVDSSGLAALGNGDRTTAGAYNPSNTWVSAAAASIGTPAIVEANFGQSRTINKITLVGIREAVSYTTPPTLSETNPSFRNINFTVDYWNGASWVNLSTITANDKVVREIAFSPVTTTKIRISVTSGATGNVYWVEIEAEEAIIDLTPPAGSITAPANNSAQSGTIIVTVAATDNIAIQSVQLKAGGVNVGTADSVAPYEISLDTTTLVNGNRSLTALITDTSGNTFTTPAVIINVYNAPPPAGELSQTYSPNSSLIAPVAIQFTDTTIGTVTEEFYDFGDYIQKNGHNPKHTYLAPGTYEVFRTGLVDGQFRQTKFPITIGGTPPEPTGTALTFDEVEINRYYTEGASGGPEFATAILGNFQGIQQRNINRYDAIHKYEFNFNGFSYEGKEFKEFRDFYYSRRGAAIGFRFFAFDDHSWNDEVISLTAPSIKTYKLIRTYKFAGREYVRRIVKPCPDLQISIGNFDASYYSAYTVDYMKGTITFATEANLPTGAKLKVTGDYCIPVVFNSDKLTASGFSSYADFEGLGVIELLPAALNIE